MFKCTQCDRELKSNAGLVRHMTACKGEGVFDVVHIDDVKPKEITLELVNDERDYYIGHPRRLIKLNGLRSRTFDAAERKKIEDIIIKLRNAN
jgi:hypothetical protein